MSRIAVLGAGLSGLTAATRLTQAGYDVTVFEARSRVGGRVWSSTIRSMGADHIIERGAEFILDGYTALGRHLGDLELVDTGMSYYIRDPGDRPGVTSADIVEAGRQAFRIAQKSHGPLTAEEVLAQLDGNPDVIDAVRARIEISTAMSSDRVTADSLGSIASFEPKTSWRIAGGNQLLPERLAAGLGSHVHLSRQVQSVQQLPDGGVIISTADDAGLFDAAVVALPLSIVRDSDSITLPLPSRRRALLHRVLQGQAAKLHLPLDEVPTTSAVMSVKDRYWTWTAVDASGSVAPVLNGFMGSPEAIARSGITTASRDWAGRVRALRHDLEIDDRADILTTVWGTDVFARGAYAAYPPGMMSAEAGSLEEPIGDIYFAGEYADVDFTGLMEGAIRSGERAADRVIARGAHVGSRARAAQV